ncbi:MAG: DNA-binding beta-propeller fold protein YncE [Myxococcota bacterium]|jgi:DNA-binding beta-propeller fold protein YncE
MTFSTSRTLGLAAILLVTSCSDDVLPTVLTLRGPVDLGLVCIKDGVGVAATECTSTEGEGFALIVNAERGSVARLRLPSNSGQTSSSAVGFKDDSAFVPGISPTALGSSPSEPSRPVAIVVAADGSASYVANLATSNLARVDSKLLASDDPADKSQAVTFQPLPSRPSDVVMRFPNGAAAGETDELLVAMTDAAAIARVPLAGFGGHSQLDSIIIPGGSPFDLAVFENTLYVGHTDVAYVSVVDLTSGLETRRIPLASPCFDDIDNNGDGFIDSADYGCRLDSAGAEAVMPAGAPPFTTVVLPTHETLPACANGVDDDGDGLADFPEDPDCMAATSAYEAPVPKPVRTRVAVSPDGTLVYATNARDRMVFAIDAVTGEPIDVNAECAPGANSLYRELGQTGILLTGVPLDVVIVQRPDETDPNDETTTIPGPLIAMVSGANGTVTIIEIEADIDGDGVRERVHRTLDANPDVEGENPVDEPVVSAPTLLSHSTSVNLGQNRRPDFPSMGEYRIYESETVEAPGFTLSEPTPCAYSEPEPQRTETDVKTRYGVVVAPNERLAIRETWEIAHEGTFLTRSAKFGAFTDVAGGGFETPELAFCDGGVQVGDTLVVHTPNGPGCGDRTETTFRFAITAVSQQKLVVDPNSGIAFEDENGDLFEDGEAQPIALSAECFPDAMGYDVRVPKGVYSVIGSVTGYLHDQTAAADGSCIVRTDADPRFNGRATEWTLATGAELVSCPPGNAEAEAAYTGDWFHNHALSFRMLPGCQGLEDGTFIVLATEPDVRWRFTLTSTLVPTTIANLGTPRSLRWLPSRDEVYAIDAGQEKIVGIPTAKMTSSELISAASNRTYR